MTEIIYAVLILLSLVLLTGSWAWWYLGNKAIKMYFTTE